MTTTAQLYAALGGDPVLHAAAGTAEELRRLVRAGLPFSALEQVMARFGLGRQQVSEVLQLPERTLARRKRERRLQPDESDRLVRLARVAAQAEETLGSAERAAVWLRRSSRALGGEAPLDLLDTDLGAREVEAILGRLEHGVYS